MDMKNILGLKMCGGEYGEYEKCCMHIKHSPDMCPYICNSCSFH